MKTNRLKEEDALLLSEMFERCNWQDMTRVARIVNVWADTVFPDRAPEAALSKLVLEEIPELLIHRKQHGMRGIGLELADCFILLLDLAVIWGVDIPQALLSKMKKNIARSWIKDEATGLYNHSEKEDDDKHAVSGSSATPSSIGCKKVDDSAGVPRTDCSGAPLSGLVPGIVLVRLPDGWHTAQLFRTGLSWRVGACTRCGRDMDWGPTLPH